MEEMKRGCGLQLNPFEAPS